MKPSWLVSNASSRKPASPNQDRIAGVRSGGLRCLVQRTSAPGAHRLGRAAAERPQSDQAGKGAGEADARLAGYRGPGYQGPLRPGLAHGGDQHRQEDPQLPELERRPASRQLHHRASFHGFSCIQPNSGAGTCPAAPARSPGAAPLHLEPGHLVNATAASAAEANNCRRADLAVIHPRCCHSRSASESPAITTSPNGMER